MQTRPDLPLGLPPSVGAAGSIWGRYRNAKSDLALLLAIVPLRRALTGYAVTVLVCLTIATMMLPPLVIVACLGGMMLAFPPVEYGLHRYVLHNMRSFLRSRVSARFWVRVHYGHHRDPARADMVLANPLTLTPVFLAFAIPFVALFGPGAAFLALAGILIPFAFIYEVVHYAAHVPARFRTRYFQRRRRIHMLHHHHSDRTNFGISTSLVDRVVGTFAPRAADAARSATVYSLGYDAEVAAAWPWVGLEHARAMAGRAERPSNPVVFGGGGQSETNGRLGA
jgi:sterol desaturase/sphingolipid hydroxylase (fatty acid hydroxylase superfamily)